MGMATFTDNQTQIKKEFDNLKNVFDKINADTISTDAINHVSTDQSQL